MFKEFSAPKNAVVKDMIKTNDTVLYSEIRF